MEQPKDMSFPKTVDLNRVYFDIYNYVLTHYENLKVLFGPIKDEYPICIYNERYFRLWIKLTNNMKDKYKVDITIRHSSIDNASLEYIDMFGMRNMEDVFNNIKTCIKKIFFDKNEVKNG